MNKVQVSYMMSMTWKFCYQSIAKASQSNIHDYTNSVTFAEFHYNFAAFQKSGNTALEFPLIGVPYTISVSYCVYKLDLTGKIYLILLL